MKSLFNLGIVFIYDLLDANGNIYSFDYIKSVLKSKINFVEYAGLKKAIQERKALLQDFVKPPLPIIPATIAIFFKDKKGCKDMYRLLVNNNKCKIKSISKWEESEVQFTELEWENIFELPFKVSQESKLWWLQFRILHRLFPYNYYLHRLKLVDSQLCAFCKRDLETIDHLFVECPCVKELWCIK